jgi:hypothetical protein
MPQIPTGNVQRHQKWCRKIGAIFEANCGFTGEWMNESVISGSSLELIGADGKKVNSGIGAQSGGNLIRRANM